MVILNVNIHRFGKLSGFKADFDPFFNLIEGANECGKSTLASFILYMLYGFDDAQTEDLAERKLRAPWDGEDVSGSMTVESEGKRYRIEREAYLDENGKRDLYRLTDLETGVTEEGGVSAGERFLGVPREVYVHTAFFGADTLLHADGELLTRAIENIIFSADERHSLSDAMKRLSDAANTIASDDGKSGALLSLKKKKEELEERLKGAREQELLLIKKENSLFETKGKRRDCERRLAESHRLETDYFNALIIRDYDRLHVLEDSAEERERAIESFESQNRKGDFLPDASYLTELATAKTDMDHAERYVKETAQTLAKTWEKGSEVTTEEATLVSRVVSAGGEEELNKKFVSARASKKKHTILLCVFFALAGVFFTGALVGFFLLGSAALLVGLSLTLAFSGIGTVCTVEFVRAKRTLAGYYDIVGVQSAEAYIAALAHASDAKRRQEAYKERVEEESAALRTAEAAKEATEKRLDEALHRWRDDIKLNENYAETVSKLSREVADYIKQAALLLREKEEAEAEVRVLRARLHGRDEIAMRALVPPAEREKLCSENNAADLRHAVEHYETMLANLVEKEDVLTKELSSLDVRENSARIMEEIYALEDKIGQLEKYVSLCTDAREALVGSFDRLRTEISPRLSLYACGLIDSLTDGKYTDLEIGDDFSLYVASESGSKEIAYLSHGTKELSYFSLRVALLDLLYRTGAPICLDETFAHQDDERAGAFMQCLRMLSAEGKQCFLFTCHARERDLADGAFVSYRRISMR